MIRDLMAIFLVVGLIMIAVELILTVLYFAFLYAVLPSLGVWLTYLLSRTIYHSLNPKAKQEYSLRKKRKADEYGRFQVREAPRPVLPKAREDLDAMAKAQPARIDPSTTEKRSNSRPKFTQSAHNRHNPNVEETRETERKLALFRRNYKQELDQLHSRKNELLSRKRTRLDEKESVRESWNDAFKAKEEAYQYLKLYKDQVDSWYAKSSRSRWLFGNAGKRFSRHSLFSQSHGDLESYKIKRDHAYRTVCEIKAEIGELKANERSLYEEIGRIKLEIRELSSQIAKVKQDRSEFNGLQAAGYSKRRLELELNELRWGRGVSDSGNQSGK